MAVKILVHTDEFRLVQVSEVCEVYSSLASVVQLFAQFSSGGVDLCKVDTFSGVARPMVRLSLTADEMAALITDYQLYLADTESSRVSVSDDWGTLDDHPF